MKEGEKKTLELDYFTITPAKYYSNIRISHVQWYHDILFKISQTAVIAGTM
jgi:hypothetical protein